MERSIRAVMIFTGLWVLVYGFGALGLAWPTSRQFFLFFTPITLFFGAVHLLWFEEVMRKRLWMGLALVWLAGFLVEWAGVVTGLVFGAYTYGSVLGPKVLGVPLIIGINWTILIYAAAQMAFRIGVSAWLRPFVGATALALSDVLIEPVAVYFEFWTWEQPAYDALFVAPWQNYLAWWLFAFAVLTAFELFKIRSHNPMLMRYWLFQLGFFLLLGILS